MIMMNFTINQPMSEWKFVPSRLQLGVGTGGGTENGSIEYIACEFRMIKCNKGFLFKIHMHPTHCQLVAREKKTLANNRLCGASKMKISSQRRSSNARIQRHRVHTVQNTSSPPPSKKTSCTSCACWISRFSSVDAMTGFHWRNTTLQRQRRRNVCYVSVLHI